MTTNTSPKAPQPKYQYWAFISYSSRDRKWAEWLHNALETYRLPIQLLKHTNNLGDPIPKQLKPMFWDRAELQAHHDLGELIERSLEQSRYLIVICSPNSAKSPWVDKEIQTFQKLHGAERILSVIIDGEPNGLGDNNCFPPTLLAHEPKAPDARKEGDGRTNAKLMLIATMLGLSFDTLKQRDLIRRRKSLQMWTAISTVILFFTGWLVWKERIAWIAETKAKAAESKAKELEKQSRLEADTQRQKAIEEKKKKEEQISKASYGDHQSGLLAVHENQYSNGLAYFVRSLNYLPGNENALAASAAAAFGPSAPSWRLRSRFLCGGSVVAITFSPDGRYLATGSKDGYLRVIEASTNKEINKLMFEDAVEKVCFSPDGRFVAGGSSDKTARLIEASSGKLIGTTKFRGSIQSLSFSLDGSRLIAGAEEIKMIDTSNGHDLGKFPFGNEEVVNSVSISSDGRFFAGGCGARLVVVDASSGKEVHQYDFISMKVAVVCFSPDGKYVAAGGMGNEAKVIVMEAASGKVVASHNFSLNVSSVCFSPDSSYLAIGSWDRSALIIDVDGGKEVKKLEFQAMVTAVEFSPDGRYIAAGGWDNRLQVAEALRDKGNKGKNDICVREFSGKITAIDFSPDGRYLAAGSEDNTIQILEPNSAKSIDNFNFEDKINSVCYSADGKLLAVGIDDNTARILETNNYLEINRVGFAGKVTSVAFSRDGKRLAAGSEDKTARVVNVANRQEVRRLNFKGSVNSVNISPDGRFLVAGSDDKTAQVIGINDGVTPFSLPQFNRSVLVVGFSPPDGRYLAVSDDEKTLWLVDGFTGKQLRKIEFEVIDGFGAAVKTFGFSASGRYLAVGSSDRRISFFDPATGERTGDLKFDDGRGVSSICFTIDGRQAVVGNYIFGAEVIEVATGRQVTSLALTDSIIGSMSFDPQGRYLALGCWDRTLRLFDWNWIKGVDKNAGEAWLHALRVQSGRVVQSSGDIQSIKPEDIKQDQAAVQNFINSSPAGSERWQHEILSWVQMEPDKRSTSPWTTEPLRVALGRWLMQEAIPVSVRENSSGRGLSSDFADQLASLKTRSLAGQAPWHPLVPVSLARHKVDETDSQQSARKACLARLTLKRLFEADVKLYGRDTLKQYAEWSAKIIHEELHLDPEALLAVNFALSLSSPEKQKELLDFKAKLRVPNPADIPPIKPKQEKTLAQTALEKGLEFQYGSNRNPSEATKFFQTSADLGNPEAQYQLAMKYMTGSGIQQNFAQVFLFSQKSAAQGNLDAKYLLGQCYLYGRGTNRDLKKAKALLDEVFRKEENEDKKYNAGVMLKMIEKIDR